MAKGKSFLLSFIQHDVMYNLRNIKFAGFENNPFTFPYFVLNSNFAINFRKLSYKSFFLGQMDHS